MEEKTELFSFQSSAKFIRQNLIVVFLVIGGILLLVIGSVQFLSAGNKSGIEFITDEKDSSSEIYVDVSGAVKKPGVYSFDFNSRINNAIDKAGGFSSEADRDYVDQNLNLAQTLIDGMKIYIPKVGEEYSGSVLGSESVSSSLININTATQNDLEELPRIGPVTAEKIITGRPYENVNDLLTKRIVGASTFDQIKDLIIAP